MRHYKSVRIKLVFTTLFAMAVPAFAGDVAQTERIELALKQAVQMALENNIDIVVARLGNQISFEETNAAKGFFRPFFSANINNIDTTAPASNQLIGADTLEQSFNTYNFTWQQELQFGMQYNLSFNNQRVSTNSAFSGFNPRFDSVIQANVSQPLVQDLNYSAGARNLVVSQNNERISREQFEIQVLNTVRGVHDAYLNLVGSIRALDVTQKSLQLAKDLLRNNQIQVEVGTMAPIDVLEAEAEVAVREEGVILAEDAIQMSQDELKRFINDPASTRFWHGEIVPIDGPTLADFEIDLEDSIRIALERRPVMTQARIQMETRSYDVRFAKNQMMPQVDMIGSLAFNGLGGDQIIRGGFAGDALNVIPGGYSEAISQLFGANFRDWTVGVNISYPLGGSSLQANHARAQVEKRQQRAQMEGSVILISQEVRQTARSVNTARKRIDATQVARELAERRLEAEQKKFEVGMSTSFFIVQAQRDLAQAQANEVQAVIDYNHAIIAFERARGTLLDRANVNVR